MSGARTRRILLACVATTLAATVGGCGDDTPTTEEPTVTENPSAGPSPVPGAGTPVPGADSPDVQASVADLAATLGVATSAVEVVAVQGMVWNDGSRGCAKKGMNYTMSIIEGSRITLRVGDTDYEYHSGGSRPPSLCERPTQ
jgi:hypothetical protein